MNDTLATFIDLVGATDATAPIILQDLGVRYLHGFDADSELDGFGDELLWAHALGEARYYEQVAPVAPYHWSVQRGPIVVTYVEGDIYITIAPTTEAAREAFRLTAPTSDT